MSIVFLCLGIFAICATFFALLLLLRGDGSKEQKLMQYFLFGALVQNAGYLLELTAPTLEAALVAVKVQYLGSLTVPISYCYFMFTYCYEKVPKKILSILSAIDAVMLCFIFTCDSHNLYYRSIEWVTVGNRRGYLNLEYGPLYRIFMLFGTGIPYLLSLYALFRVCIRKPEYAADRRCGLVLVLSFLPVGALCAYSMKLTQIYDPTPAALGLVLSGVVILIWSRRVYDFSSLAFGILLNSMSDGVIALDEQRQITNYNSSAAGIFRNLNSRAIGEDIETLEGFPKEILRSEVKQEFSLNGRFYQGRVEPILDYFGKNKGHVVLIYDVTETRNYIEEIKQVREQAEQANLAKSAFLANMSHEIRTPMNAIVGLSDIIMEESKGRKVYEYACDIKSASRNLLALINDILDLSKVEAGRMELVLFEYHLKGLVDEVANMMDVMASQRGLMMKKSYDMSLPCKYFGDGGRIRQILINLLNNSMKFTKEGHVGISVTGVRGETEDVELLSFRIEDTGCGIKEEDLKSIFEDFKQVDSERNRMVEGTGLGLSITKQLVELMQGTIRVESVYGEGTTFIVEIPQKIMDYQSLAEAPEAEVQREEELRPFTAKSCKVLVVDDNAVNRKIAKIFLQSYNFEIAEADSGAAAIELVRQTRYDIIFMDHMMPEMDGIEAVRIIRSECGENGTLPVVIALTANAMEGVREKFLKNGFQDFITKPLDRRMLHDALLRWIPEEKRDESGTWGGGHQSDNGRSAEFEKLHIEGIDTEEVLKRYSGNVEDFRELLSLYCIDGKRKLTVLQELWEKGDYKTYGIEVHGLKSASANVGAMDISVSAKEHELAVDRGDTAFVDEHVHQLLIDYGMQLEHISRYFEREKEQKESSESPAKEELEKGELIQRMKDALESLEDFRAKDCAQKIEEILQYQVAAGVEAKLTEIIEQLKLYEDETAEQILRELIDIADSM